jgi:hypothetical protein
MPSKLMGTAAQRHGLTSLAPTRGVVTAAADRGAAAGMHKTRDRVSGIRHVRRTGNEEH